MLFRSHKRLGPCVDIRRHKLGLCPPQARLWRRPLDKRRQRGRLARICKKLQNSAMKKTATLVCALTLAAGAQAACYTVMGPRGQILSETSTPPVDMRYQLHQTVPYKYGRGASMVFGIADNNCGPEIDPYYDLMPTQVVYREGRRARVRHGMRAPRRDRE